MNINKTKDENSTKIRQIMEDNPDLSYDFVRQLLVIKAEIASGQVTTYQFD